MATHRTVRLNVDVHMTRVQGPPQPHEALVESILQEFAEVSVPVNGDESTYEVFSVTEVVWQEESE